MKRASDWAAASELAIRAAAAACEKTSSKEPKNAGPSGRDFRDDCQIIEAEILVITLA